MCSLAISHLSRTRHGLGSAIYTLSFVFIIIEHYMNKSFRIMRLLFVFMLIYAVLAWLMWFSYLTFVNARFQDCVITSLGTAPACLEGCKSSLPLLCSSWRWPLSVWGEAVTNREQHSWWRWSHAPMKRDQPPVRHAGPNVSILFKLTNLPVRKIVIWSLYLKYTEVISVQFFLLVLQFVSAL